MTRCSVALDALGVRVERRAGRGYRLADPIDLLDASAIRADLAPGLSLDVLDRCASTNVELMARVAAGAPSGTALACEIQTAGRGRRGNDWVTPLGGGLAFSLAWRMPRVPAGLAGLSLAAGVACARALARLGFDDVGLKWPNDIVHCGRKLGGILVEASGDGGRNAVVCGVGLNTRLNARARAGIAQPVVDLAALSPTPPTRGVLLAALLNGLAEAMETFGAHGFAAFREAWLRHHVHQGEQVRLMLADRRVVEGRALGVADDGALLLDHDGRIEPFHAGEVSLRRAA